MHVGEVAGRAALLAFPAVLLLYLSFNAGGFFPDSVAFATILVLQALVLRTTLSQDPVGGFRLAVAIPAIALALLTGWILLSASWSEAPGRAMVEANRALLYALVFVLFASMRRAPGTLRWMVRGISVALLAVSVTALATWLLRDTFPIDFGNWPDRLNYPITYWNALGVMAAVGLILALHLASDRLEPVAVRALAAGAVPLFATTILFTFSRGSIAVTAIGVIVYLVLTHGPGQLAAVAVIAPLTAVAVVIAYRADELAASEPQSALAVEQGKDVATWLALIVVATIVLRAVVALVGPRLTRRFADHAREERMGRFAWAGVALVMLVALLAVGAPGRAADAYDDFFHGEKFAQTDGDLRNRLDAAESTGRTQQWQASLDGFGDEPLRGHGAGMYEALWNAHRDEPGRVIDGHSLYLETLGEIGLVGGLLLLVAFGGILVAFARGLRGPDRALSASLVAIAVVWFVHAGIDWDWEMPATGIALFALGGTAAARATTSRRSTGEPSRAGRWVVVAALGWIILAAGPLFIMLSEGRLASAQSALEVRDCDTGITEALDSIEMLSARREPYEIIGFCQSIRGFPRQGVDAMLQAVDRDPQNWEARYGLALLRGQAGQDPRPDLERAIRLSPVEPLLLDARKSFREAARSRWPEVAVDARETALQSGQLTVNDQ